MFPLFVFPSNDQVSRHGTHSASAWWHGRSGRVLVVSPHPELCVTFGLIAAFGHQVKELIGAIDHIDATGIGGVGVEDLPGVVLAEHADAFAVLKARVCRAVVVDGGMAGKGFGRERRAKVVVEVGLGRRKAERVRNTLRMPLVDQQTNGSRCAVSCR